MKTKNLPLFLAALFLAQSAHSDQFTWDITSGDSAITGGTGTWNTSTGNWTKDGGVNNVVWGNSSADEAIFGGTAGTVTINTGTGVTANKLTFNTTGYTITGGTQLSLAGTTPTISVGTGLLATINSKVFSGTTFTKSGAGALLLTITGASNALNTTNKSVIIEDGALSGAVNSGNTLVLNGGVFSPPSSSVGRALLDSGQGTSYIQFTGSGGYWAYGGDKTANLGSASSVTWASTLNFLGNDYSFLLSHEAADSKITFETGIDLNGAARTFDVRNGSAAIDAALSGVLSGSGSSGLLKQGAGTLSLTNANTYEGSTTISAGSLQIGGGGTIGRLTATSSITNNANLTINRSDAFTQATDLGAGAVISGTGSFTQAGTGTTTLTANNTYTGATNITSGTLLINGNQSAATGAVSVSAAATLGGNGTVGGATTFTGASIHAPGSAAATVGSQSFSSSLTYGSGTIFEWDLNSLTTDPGEVSNASTGTYDQVTATGAITGGSAIFKIVLAGEDAFTDAFWNTNKSWTNIFTGGSGSASNLAALFSGFDASGGLDSSGIVTGRGQFTLNSSTNTLNWTAVPEPASTLAGLLLTAGLLRRRRV